MYVPGIFGFGSSDVSAFDTTYKFSSNCLPHSGKISWRMTLFIILLCPVCNYQPICWEVEYVQVLRKHCVGQYAWIQVLPRSLQKRRPNDLSRFWTHDLVLKLNVGISCREIHAFYWQSSQKFPKAFPPGLSISRPALVYAVNVGLELEA